MSITDFITRLLGRGEETADGFEQLQQYLEAQQAVAQFEVEYGRPTISTLGEPTAQFPYTIYDDGVSYGAGAKEFPIPDNGMQDTGAPLTRFLHAHSISTVGDLGAIEGQRDSAELTDGGDLEVQF